MSLKDTVQAWEDRYAAVLGTPGALGLENFFTDDADLLPPGPDNLKGIEAIQNFWSDVTRYYHNVKLRTQDAEQMGTDHIRNILCRIENSGRCQSKWKVCVHLETGRQ